MLAKYKSCYGPSNRDDFFNDFVSSRYYGRNYASAPAVNIIKEEEGYRIEVAAAGLSREDFKIQIDNDVLTISSEQKSKQKEDQDSYTRREFNYTTFSRSFQLDESVDQDSISATHDNGVLTVHLQLKEQEVKKGPKSIEIN